MTDFEAPFDLMSIWVESESQRLDGIAHYLPGVRIIDAKKAQLIENPVAYFDSEVEIQKALLKFEPSLIKIKKLLEED